MTLYEIQVVVGTLSQDTIPAIYVCKIFGIIPKHFHFYERASKLPDQQLPRKTRGVERAYIWFIILSQRNFFFRKRE